jgi:hypothetical protein
VCRTRVIYYVSPELQKMSSVRLGNFSKQTESPQSCITALWRQTADTAAGANAKVGIRAEWQGML